MSWRTAIAAYLAWFAGNTVAGVVFALGSAPFLRSIQWWGLPIDGLFAGIVFGLAQWLALRPFLAELRLWAPVTIVASPLSWLVGYLFGMATITLGGWIGAAISATGQTVVMVWSLQRDRLLVGLSFLWIPAVLIGGTFFYFCYLWALLGGPPTAGGTPSPFLMILAGSVGYAILTGPVIAALAGLAALRRPPELVAEGAR